MPLDAYQPCPCGSQKKVKFCCSKDIASELDKIFHSIQANQRVAALEQINRLVAAKGERDCLMVTKASVLMQLGQIDKSREIVETMLERQPENPLVLGQAALLALEEQDVDEAVVLLQNALNQVEESVPGLLVDVIRLVGISLHMSGRFPAARTHLAMYQRTVGKEDQQVMSLLVRSYSSPQIPLLLKEDYPLVPAPEGAEWASELDDIRAIADQGRFRSAIERLRELEAKFSAEPVIRRNIAVLENRLGDTPAIVDAWRTYARTPGVDLEDAIEAEAIAQLLDDDPDRDYVEEVVVSIDIDDVSKVMETLTANPLFDFVPNSDQMRSEDGPPPKAIFHMLDKPIPMEDAALSLDTVPTIEADVYVFGRETDRSARLVVQILKDEQFEARLDKLRSELGELLGEQTSEDVMDQLTRQAAVLSWRWRFPETATAETRRNLAIARQEKMMLETWPDLKLDILDGKSPREAAGDEEYQLPLLAAILLLEDTGDYHTARRLDINRLRESLSLPPRQTTDPTQRNIQDLSLTQFSKVDFAKASDEDLLYAIGVASMNGIPGSMIDVYRERLNRDSISDEQFGKSQAYASLARLVESDDEALELIDKAKEYVESKNESINRLLVYEFELRLERQIMDGTRELMERLEKISRQDPDTMQALGRVLERFGFIQGAGQAAGRQQAPSVPTPSTESALWTPGAESAPATPAAAPNPAGEKPEGGSSGLWLPGMD